MSRLRQFARGVGSSWLATLATVIYSLVSVPLALTYLTVDEFALFVLLIQVSTYFSLIEIGMSASTARILVDHKDNPSAGHYGSVILTGFCFFMGQALLVVVLGLLAAPAIVSLIGVPADFREVAVILLKSSVFASALTMAFRIFASVLYANQRLDLIHAFTGVNLLFGLGLLAFILSSGSGLRGLTWFFVAQASIGACFPILACVKLRLLPGKGGWGRPSMDRFHELFLFGKDVFLVNVGNQILEASQLIIITRTMGLTSAAMWSVSTKLFALVYQLITKIEGTALVFFAEMMVRKEHTKLATRFRQVFQLTSAFAVVGLAVVVGINKSFVSVWAEPSLVWSMGLNVLMAILVFLNSLTRCSGDLIIHTKKIAFFRYVYFAEAACFVLLALYLGRYFGFYGVLGAAVLCILIFRVTYTTHRIADFFGLNGRTIWFTWLKRPLAACLILSPFVFSADYLARLASNDWQQLFIVTVWVGVPASVLLFFSALPRDVRREVILNWQRFDLFGKRRVS